MSSVDRGAQPMGERRRMPCRPGAHVAYAQGADLVVEWHDFGDHVPYESANMLIFAPAAQERLAAALEAQRGASADALAELIAARFHSYWDVREFAQSRGIPFTKAVDFQP
jgi:hypothetical protein